MEFFLPNGEKRAFPRIRLALATDIELIPQGELLTGRCLDISTTGARLHLNRELAIGTRLQFRLREHMGMEPFMAEAEVTRVIPVKAGEGLPPVDENGYELGVKILRIESR